MNDLGGLETIDFIKLKIVEANEESIIKEYLDTIKVDLFDSKELNESKLKLVKELFDDDALMNRYLKTCSRAYDEIKVRLAIGIVSDR